MPAEVMSNVFLNFGLVGLIVFAFFVLVFWIVKSSNEREDKLYKIIGTLSSELPEIRDSLKKIEKKLN